MQTVKSRENMKHVKLVDDDERISMRKSTSELQDVTASTIYNSWCIGSLDTQLPTVDLEQLQQDFEDQLMKTETIKQEAKIFALADAIPLVTEAASVIVDDEFTKCFDSKKPVAWNWNPFLYTLWCIGVLIRYGILFPMRALIFVFGLFSFLVAFFFVSAFCPNRSKEFYQKKLLQYWFATIVLSWTGVIRYRGIRPKPGPNQVYVANHSSMIDVIILSQHTSYATVGQLHKGLVGWTQTNIIKCLGSLWFNRADMNDRVLLVRKIKEHVQDPKKNPLLIFPEGTCVNNKYCVMFKKGAFELGCQVNPVAIKYNKEFCDGYWNSRKESFWNHVFHLMTQWAVVCDVYYLEPQTILPDETPTQFAARVKDMIAAKAKLKSVQWDGYLKHLRPSSRFKEHRQNLIAQTMLRRFPTLEQTQNN